MSRYHANKRARTIIMEKSIQNGSNVSTELIKDCIALSGMFGRSFKYIPIIDTILNNLESNTNVFIGTYQKVSEDLKISYATVVRTFQTLINHGIIERVNKGVYKLNTIFMKTNAKSLRIKYISGDCNGQAKNRSPCGLYQHGSFNKSD